MKKRFLIAYLNKYDEIIAEKIFAKNQIDAINKLKIQPHLIVAISKIKF